MNRKLLAIIQLCRLNLKAILVIAGKFCFKVSIILQTYKRFWNRVDQPRPKIDYFHRTIERFSVTIKIWREIFFVGCAIQSFDDVLIIHLSERQLVKR